MKKLLALILCFVLAFSVLSLGVSAETMFPDVSENDWFFEAVKFCYEKNYIKGYADGRFGPADKILRQDFVCILARVDGVDLSKYDYKSKFSDVPEGDYFTASINWASENNIVGGYSGGKVFGAADPINREQLVSIFYRYEVMKHGTPQFDGSKAKAFPDYNEVSDWARTATEWAIDKGVISGKGGTFIAPAQNALRCEVAQIFMNIYISSNVYNFIRDMVIESGTRDVDPDSYYLFFDAGEPTAGNLSYKAVTYDSKAAADKLRIEYYTEDNVPNGIAHIMWFEIPEENTGKYILKAVLYKKQAEEILLQDKIEIDAAAYSKATVMQFTHFTGDSEIYGDLTKKKFDELLTGIKEANAQGDLPLTLSNLGFKSFK